MSIYGGTGQGDDDGVARIRVQIPLPSWHIQRKCFVANHKWQEPQFSEFIESMKSALTWEKNDHELENFACYRRSQNISLSESCKSSDDCKVDLTLNIFNPTEDDSGYYRAVFRGIVEADMVSPRVFLNIDTGTLPYKCSLLKVGQIFH